MWGGRRREVWRLQDDRFWVTAEEEEGYRGVFLGGQTVSAGISI
jgi:hypothetical protein